MNPYISTSSITLSNYNHKKNGNKSGTKRDPNLKYLYFNGKNYYFIKRIQGKILKIPLKSNDLIYCIHKKNRILKEIENMIFNKDNFNPNFSITLDSQSGELKLTTDENDKPEDLEKMMRIMKEINSPNKTQLELKYLFSQFINMKKSIDKRGEEYISELKNSLNYLEFFVKNYEIQFLEDFTTKFFNQIQRDFISYIPKRFFHSRYKNYSLEELKNEYIPKEKKLNSRTINKHFIYFHEFFKFLERESILKPNPIKIKFIKTEDSRIEEFFEDELKIIFNNFENEELNFLKCLLYTGMRNKELSTIKIKDIKNDCFYIQNSKTINGIRIIPIHSHLKNIIKIQSFKKKKEEFLFFNGDDVSLPKNCTA